VQQSHLPLWRGIAANGDRMRPLIGRCAAALSPSLCLEEGQLLPFALTSAALSMFRWSRMSEGEFA